MKKILTVFLVLHPFLGFFTLLVTGQDQNSDSRPWFKAFVARRTFYVSPSGKGDGKKVSDPMDLKKALKDASPGDLFWLLEGVYKGTFVVEREGKEESPILFRADKGKHVIIEGGFSIKARYNWIWGFEIINPNYLQSADGGAEMLAPGIRVINCVIHDQYGNIGIGAWQQGEGQVIYGNIVYKQIPESNNPHNLYIQNDYDNWGYKYAVNNILMDANDVNDKTYNVHAYTEGGLITGLWFENNVIKNGKFLIGGYNAPAEHEVVKQNYFYETKIQFGYRRPTQVRFQDNYVARSSLITEWVWGAGETQFNQTDPSVYTGNEFVYPPGPHLRFSTSAYLASGRCEGCPKIRPNDIFDQNKYSVPFRATFYADSKNIGMVDLDTWRRVTGEAGKAFDLNSVEIPAPKGVKTGILKNDYDPLRAHLVIYNWSNAQKVTVDLSSYLPTGTKFSIFDAKQAFQNPVLSRVYSGPIEVPSSGEFGAFLITRE